MNNATDTVEKLSIPGPTGRRVLGNLFDFSSDPLTFLTHAAREHGDVVAIGSHNVLLTHPRDIENMLVDREGRFSKARVPGSSEGRRGQGFPHAMMNSDGDDWRTKRDRLQPSFSRHMTTTAAEVVRVEAERTLNGWALGSVQDLQEHVARLTLRVVTRLLFGESFSSSDVEIVAKLVAAVMDLATTPIILPEWVPTPKVVRIRRSLRQLDEVLARVATSPLARDRERAPVLHALMSATPKLSSAELRDEFATLVMAGYETTNDAVVWASYLLAQHPNAAQRVAEEADAATQKKAPSVERMESLRYTHAVLKEAMRLYSPVWITSRDCLCDVEYAGHRIPRGTTVTVSQWVTHRDPRFFSDAHRFVPERWLDSSNPPIRGSYFPFGLGPRACIGAAVATTEAVILLAEINRRFRLELVDPSAVRPRPVIALQPVGVRVRVRRRETIPAPSQPA
ncbi:cytochrome P450 [Pendulispora rubella]|uniref:Cytochrome P450 n=1 Tax=Pendulispora rubella TaxID=2741070 RepID=A0ABZ2LJT3_9BACT